MNSGSLALEPVSSAASLGEQRAVLVQKRAGQKGQATSLLEMHLLKFPGQIWDLVVFSGFSIPPVAPFPMPSYQATPFGLLWENWVKTFLGIWVLFSACFLEKKKVSFSRPFSPNG